MLEKLKEGWKNRANKTLDQVNEEEKLSIRDADLWATYLAEARKIHNLIKGKTNKLAYYNKAMTIQIKYPNSMSRIIYYILQELGQIVEVKSEIVDIDEFQAANNFHDNIKELNTAIRNLMKKIEAKDLMRVLESNGGDKK